jgi:hypothetical protein
MINTPWAILLCKFSDSDAEPYPRQRFEEIFTTAGSGKFNMTDFFRDMSHGKVDLSGSRIFPSAEKGWYKLTQKSTDYLGAKTKPDGRATLLDWARQAASDNGDTLNGFFNIVVVTNVPADLYGGTDGAACDDGRNRNNGMSSLSPSLLGQEMGHGYGLNHSRLDGSGDDYKDPWDVMSTASAYMAPHPFYTERDVRANPIFRIGPGLNAANMSYMGWLDTTRVWTADTGRSLSSVQLRPLHRRDLPGYLCARYGELFIEFRMNDGWDSAIGGPVVLIHDLFDGYSYLYTDDSGTTGLEAGDSYSNGDTTSEPPVLHGSGLKITVTSIDATNQTANIQIQSWKSAERFAGPSIPFGGVDAGGGGWVFTGSGLVRVPPRSPLVSVLDQLALIVQSHELPGAARDIVQRQAYEELRSLSASRLEAIVAPRSPSSTPLQLRGAEGPNQVEAEMAGKTGEKGT